MSLAPTQLIEILRDIRYKDWELRSNVHPNALIDPARPLPSPWIQWRFMAPDNITGTPELQSCRKWLLSWHMTPSEVVRTAYMAAQQAEAHECAENFLYNGAMLYNPHTDLRELAYCLNTGVIGDDLR